MVTPAPAESPATVCPVCGEPGIPIAYGYPGLDLFEAAQRGELALGGCLVSGDDPTHTCSALHRWVQSR